MTGQQNSFTHMTDDQLIAIIRQAPTVPNGYHDVMPRGFDYTAHENAKRAREALDKRLLRTTPFPLTSNSQ